MVGTKTLLCGVWLCGFSLSAGVALADGQAGPRSLRMRPTDGAHGGADKRVGQVPGDPDDADADADEALPDEAPPAAAPAPAPVARPRVAPPVFAAPPSADGWQVTADDAANFVDRRPARATGRFVITGSLIERASQTTPSPLTILPRAVLLGAGRSMIGDVLQPLPEQANGINAQTNNGGDGSTRMDLRSLGVSRTLVLLNGRRFVPVGLGADNTVDLNTIPLAAIERVEVLKDAGSTVYGSDAIAGVVNLITRSDFHGTEASLYTAQTERRDGFTFDASMITGHRIADGRGNIVFSAGTQRQEPVFAGDRDFSKSVFSFDFRNMVATPTGSSATPNGRIDARAIDLNGDGRPDTVNLCGTGVRFCTNDGAGGFRPFLTPQDLYNFQPVNYLYTPSSRTNAYTVGTFRLQPQMEGFFEASFMHRNSQQQLAPDPIQTSLFGIVISRDSIYNPIGGDVLSYNRRVEEFGPRRFDQSVDTMRTVAGVRSTDTPPGAWQWELSFNYGRTDATNRQEGHEVLSKLANAVGPSFVNAQGVPTCGTPSAQIAGCVPMNLLGASGSITQAMRNYTGFTGVDTGNTVQQMALATAHGEIARLPGGGDVSLAITADVRKETGEFRPDELIASGDTTAAGATAVSGSTNVAEVAAELQIVPVRDRDGVERLELDLATRAFHYDTFGDGAVSSARALVRPVRGITLRASWSDAFRAPSLTELFQASQDDFPLITDPCDRAFGTPSPQVAAECAREGVPAGSVFGTQQQHAITRGNPQLQPETAKVMSAGVVLETSRVPGVSLSVDWWNINMTQQVQTLLIQNIFANCYQRGQHGFCDLIRRDPTTHAIDVVDVPFFNTGGTSTSGVDAAINIDHHTRGAGDLHARVELQQLDTYDFDTGNGTVLNGVGVYDLGVLPRRKLAVSAAWKAPQGLSAGFNFHFIDSFQECQNDDCNDPQNPQRTVDSYSKLDVFGSLTMGGRRTAETTLTVGVNNVFDRQPPVIYNGASGNYDTTAYDMLGRFMYARLTQSF
jgi:iron complex outermembrane recepter protein